VNRIGFKAYYNKQCYGVQFFDFLNKDKTSHLPQVTKRLIHDSFFADVKAPELTGKGGGERFVRELPLLKGERITRY
jgi:hypothetical protein